MTRINTNVASLRGLRSLNRANNLLGTSLTRLSTGLKINTGKDDPTGLIASETLRLQITSIEQSIKNSNRANNVIATSDAALGEIGGLLNQIRGLVQEGLNEGALSTAEIEANQLQIDAALSAINRIAANTSFAGEKLIDGSKSFTTQLTTADAAKLSDFQINEALFGTSSTVEVNATVTTVAEKASLQYAGGGLTSATTLEVAGAKGQQVLFLGGSSTVSNIRDAVNSVSDVTGVEARINQGAGLDYDAVAASLNVDPAGNNNALTFTDARATATESDPAELGGDIAIVYAVAGNNTALSVGTATANGTTTITVNVATDANGAATSTANQILAAIQGDANASALVDVALTTGNDGTGVVAAAATADLAGNLDAASLRLVDSRTDQSAGALSIELADPAGNSQALAVSVSGTAITVSLATDANGNITSTLDDIAAAINADATATALVDASVTGEGTQVAVDTAATDFTDNEGNVILESQNYGADEFVEINVLNGTFATTLSDGTTALSRDAGVDIGVSINGQDAETKGLEATIRSASLDATLNFEEASNVANTNAVVTITGGGSLFQIGQEASAAGQVGIGIEAVNTARLGGVAGKLYELGSGGGKSLLDVGPTVQGSALVDVVEQALERVSTLRGRLGAIQKNVIETNITTLGVALENISEARSSIIDTDFAEETANLTKGQILSQAGISVLAIANQNPGQVLSLLG